MSPDKQTLDALRIDRTGVRNPRPLGAIAVVASLLISTAAGLIWWYNLPQMTEVRTTAVREVLGGGGAERVLLNASGYVTARRPPRSRRR